ncbi:hypothetical protein ACF0H5_009053 [Mactra antiquata]
MFVEGYCEYFVLLKLKFSCDRFDVAQCHATSEYCVCASVLENYSYPKPDEFLRWLQCHVTLCEMHTRNSIISVWFSPMM